MSHSHQHYILHELRSFHTNAYKSHKINCKSRIKLFGNFFLKKKRKKEKEMLDF